MAAHETQPLLPTKAAAPTHVAGKKPQSSKAAAPGCHLQDQVMLRVLLLLEVALVAAILAMAAALLVLYATHVGRGAGTDPAMLAKVLQEDCQHHRQPHVPDSTDLLCALAKAKETREAFMAGYFRGRPAPGSTHDPLSAPWPKAEETRAAETTLGQVP